MISCKKATTLIEKEQVDTLSLKERINLRIHTSMCKACRSYEKQSVILNQAIGKWFGKQSPSKEALSDEVKERIKRNIEDQ